MSNETIKKYIGSQTDIITMLGERLRGKIVNVEENWIEVQTRRHNEFVNIEFIERFRII